MAFALSPGVTVQEMDMTSIVPAVSSSAGAFAGAFSWGPVLDPVTISSENVLAQRFGKPNDNNFNSFFTAANFLAYTNNLLVVRADAENLRNAVSTPSGSVSEIEVTVPGADYTEATIAISAPDDSDGIQATATATIDLGVITEITITNPGSGYTEAPTVTITGDGTDAVATATVTVTGVKIKNFDEYSSQYINGSGVYGSFAAKYPGSLGNSILVSMADGASFTDWAYANEFDGAPSTSSSTTAVGGSNDELHVIIIDEDGLWTGVRGGILEKFAYVSKASDSRRSDGTNNYYKDVLNSQSRYIWWMDHPAEGTNWGSESLNVTFVNLTDAISTSLSGGVDDYASSDGDLQTAYLIFANDELYDISLIPVGKASAAVAAYVINNVAETRRDCVVFVSPENITTGEIVLGNNADPVGDIIAYRNELPSTSYAVMDSGFKYQYDRYNDKYRFVPLNGDIAGLCARTDYTNDAWWSPAGYNRGQIKNVIRLAVNPNKTDRDNLYKAGVNPVVAFPGQGTVLYGDKTLLAKPSAFDRINVRRLFIVLEKAIATAAKYQLFEFNDEFTRAQFRNMVEPFLRDVQGRRGVTDFRVKCDASNNTGEVIDRNEFVGQIFLKPNRSINFINLTFVAARSSVSFEEIGA